LFVSAGDGAWADRIDVGQNIVPQDEGCEATFGDQQDVGAGRAQLVSSLSGKVLRIDPNTGEGLPSNPFWNGNPQAAPSKVWVLGLRNAFRFTVKPGSGNPGTLFLSEVGWTTWEELNVAHFGGENFGWPCYEGMDPQPEYALKPETQSFCAEPYGQLTSPILTWHHDDPSYAGFTGFASTGAIYYDHVQFPAAYRDGLFFCDFGAGWIRFARLDSEDRVVGVESFAFGVAQPVDLRIDPVTGDLLYVSIGPGKIHRIRFSAGNVAPVVEVSATPSAGPAPLSVLFSSSGTADANGDPMTFEWDFGDGSPVSTDPNPAHVYSSIGTFVATLVVQDTDGLTGSKQITIETQNVPPEVILEFPTNGYRFDVGEMILLSATVMDREDGVLSPQWEVQLVHNSHIHPQWFVWDGSSPPPFEAEDHSSSLDDRFSYRVIVQATDSGGLTTAREAFLIPSNLPANTAPVVNLGASITSGSTPLPVYFDGTFSYDPDGDLLFPHWDFGGGLQSNTLTPSHIFGTYGEHLVRLTMSDVVLASSSATIPILVFPGRALEAHWSFDERGGPTAIDMSGHNHDAALTGATIAEGVLGASYHFDGLDDYLTVTTSLLSDRTEFTVAGWIRPDILRARMGIVGQQDVFELGFVEADTVALSTAQGGEVRAMYAGEPNEWHHIAAIGNGSTLALAIDGEIVKTGGYSTYSYGASEEPVYIGASTLPLRTVNLFQGRIDEVRFYAKALDPAEILFLGTHPRLNYGPRVEAGPDRTAVVGEVVRLTGIVSDDGLPEGSSVAFSWSQSEGPHTVAIDDPASLVQDVRFLTPGTFAFRLSATDGAIPMEDEVVIDVREVGDLFGVAGIALRDGIETVGPNPSRDRVAITFGVLRRVKPVRVAIVDIQGRVVQRFPETRLQPGRYRVDWNGKDEGGNTASVGIYFAVVDVGPARTTEKLVLLR
jgi:PKD repeat protein